MSRVARLAAVRTLSPVILFFSALLCVSGARGETIVLKGGNVVGPDGQVRSGVDVLIDGRVIKAVGKGLSGDRVIDVTGKTVMPGLVEAHSHMGVYPYPGTRATADGNEMTNPVMPGVWSADGFHVGDPAIARARAYGVTTIQVLPGSGNNIGGMSVVLKLRPSRTLSGLLFKEAPRGMKHAMGENPKRVYGRRGKLPSTRMGNLLVMRRAYAKAVDYRKALRRWKRKKKGPRPGRDIHSEALLDVIDGKIRLHVHCYRTDGIEALFRLADEFGFKVAALHHALEAYKIPKIIKKRDVVVVTFSDLGYYKVEAFKASTRSPAILAKNAGFLSGKNARRFSTASSSCRRNDIE